MTTDGGWNTSVGSWSMGANLHSYPIKHFVVIDPRQEPDALVAQVRICAGGTGKPVFLPRLRWRPLHGGQGVRSVSAAGSVQTGIPSIILVGLVFQLVDVR